MSKVEASEPRKGNRPLITHESPKTALVTTGNGNSEIVTAEYVSLREEILKHLELKHQLVSLTLAALAGLLTFGLQKDSPGAVVLVYPLIASFLSAEWAWHYVRIRQIAAYIRRIENRTSGLGWGNFLKEFRSRSGFLSSFSISASAGLFLSTQVLTAALGILVKRSSFGIGERTLLCLDIISILITISIFYNTCRSARIFRSDSYDALSNPVHSTSQGIVQSDQELISDGSNDFGMPTPKAESH